MVKLGLIWTGYLVVSLAIFLATSFTVNGWIVYGLFLLPFYGFALLFGWLRIVKNKTKKPQFKTLIWAIALVLQLSVILTAPGNCYMAKQGASCYSNLQVIVSNVPRLGATDLPHWTTVENAFFGLLPAYAVALTLGVATTSFKASQNDNASES